MKCFYHTDVDGKCSGAIVKKFYDEHDDAGRESKEEYIGIDYKDDFPFNTIIHNETIIIVDFSLQKEGDFEKLFNITDKVIWIDHHKTAIEKHHNIICGGIRDLNSAGCELTWKYFFPQIDMPISVKLAGRYDVWDFSVYGEALNKFQAGIRLQPHEPYDEIWRNLLLPCSDCIDTLLHDGGIALKYRDNQYASLIKALSFFSEFEGYKIVCCNAGLVSSQLFDSVKEDYDIMVPFYFDGKQWTVSLYTKKEIDCSEIAKKYGGGGHKKAAGFQCLKLPFIKN